MKKRIISMLLTVLMLLSVVTAVPAFAEELVVAEYDHLTTVFKTPEERLAKMKLYSSFDGYEIYADSYSGEVAFKDLATGQVLFTNPYDVGASKASAAQKYELLSQIIVKYTDNNVEKIFTSYEQAAMRGQISIENIKKGIRVNYSLGNEETRLLVPRLISKDRFEQEILKNIKNKADLSKMTAFYNLKDASTCKIELLKEQIYAKWPITRKMPVYVISADVTEVDLRKIEAIIKEYCPDYTFEQLDYDHRMTEYEGEDREPANFKMAIEYTIDNGSLVANLPANGIRYNETEYNLVNIQMLPYMGAGKNPNHGYTFLPDGAGAIFKFEDLDNGNATTVSTTMYGIDYAFQTISGSYEQTARVPVFGIVEEQSLGNTATAEKAAAADTETAAPENTEAEAEEADAETAEAAPAEEKANVVYDGDAKRGFVAIIEEGDAMCQLSTYHGGAFHEYNTVKMTYTPRPKDSYNLATAISVGSNSTWTVVSERRYTGNYRIRYKLLTDPELGVEDTYETSWIGMAKAYQDYLIDNGVLTKITEDEVGDGIPLYIETFGAAEDIKKILSIPVTVKVAMTSFDDIQTIYSDLSSEGISNINFKLTGYSNGGMTSTVPYKLKWEKSVGGKNGFKELLDDAKEKDYGVYPDFDFAYINKTAAFDGVTLKKHAVKSIDNRYTSKRVYSAARQNYATYYQLAMSPAYYYRFIDKLAEKYTDYEPIGISVSTLGTALNTDFDKKEPYNREDAKNYTFDAFESLDASYGNVMTEGGNSFVWKYADHILNIPLDSSRYIKATYTVPFIGYVLHGYVNFTGSAINMAGDIRYEVLKCIENGAYMYFILSYDHTEILKEDVMLSKYYSIRYDIWHDDLVELYNELNGILEPLQTKNIVDHEFLIGERIPDEDETPDTEGTGKYRTMDDGRIVKVTYENGTTFILNYNYFAVNVEGVNVDAYGYVQID